jgi:hypothetical protein
MNSETLSTLCGRTQTERLCYVFPTNHYKTHIKMSIKIVTKQSCYVNFSLAAKYMNAPP